MLILCRKRIKILIIIILIIVSGYTNLYSFNIYTRNERKFGCGFNGGVGFAIVQKTMIFGFVLPTLELKFFVNERFSIDLYMPISDMIIIPILSLGNEYAFDIALYFDFHFNINYNQNIDFILAPGIEVGSLNSYGYFFTILKIPMRIGFEFMNIEKSFGFQILARPVYEATIYKGSVLSSFGVILEIGFSWYKER